MRGEAEHALYNDVEDGACVAKGSNLRSVWIDAPEEDGIVLVDLKTGREKQVIVLSELAAGAEGRAMHYINHISLSPKEELFNFYHLCTNMLGVEILRHD